MTTVKLVEDYLLPETAKKKSLFPILLVVCPVAYVLGWHIGWTLMERFVN